MNFEGGVFLGVQAPVSDVADAERGSVLQFQLRPIQSSALSREVKVAVFDFDGTIHNSYENFRAVSVLKEWIADSLRADPELAQATASRFIEELKTFSGGVQPILHRRKPTLRFFEKFVHENNVPLNQEQVAAVVDYVRTLQNEAFKVVPYFQAVLDKFSEAGTRVVINTNSGNVSLFQRMRKCGLLPSNFDVIVTNAKNGHDFKIIDGASHVGEAFAFAARNIQYHHAKPNSQLIEAIAASYGVAVEEVAVCGEGISDLKTVPRDTNGKLRGRFIFQAEGAKKVDRVIQRINEELRPGVEHLGLEAVMQELTKMEIGPSDYTHLGQGFKVMSEMIDDGRLPLGRPPHRAQVDSGRIVRIG